MFRTIKNTVSRMISTLTNPQPKPHRRPSAASQAKRRESRKLILQSLEKRNLMAVDTLRFEGNRLIVAADDLNTHVVVRQVGSQISVLDVGTKRSWNYESSRVGSVEFIGGNGNDRFVSHVRNLPVRAFGYGGADYLRGNNGADYLDGGGNDDVIIGGGGDDTLVGSAGDDLILGMDGHDRIIGGPGDDTLHGDAGDDVVRGGTGDDRIRGDGGNDSLYGGAGTDLIRGDDGDDSLYGGDGVDQLFGGNGDDGIFGGVGENDRLTGGAGEDRFLVNSATLRPTSAGESVRIEDTITDKSAGDSVTHFRNLEQKTLDLQGIAEANFAAGDWTDANIEAIDEALRTLHQLTGNTKLLKTSSGGELVFERAGSPLNQLDITEPIAGWNSGNGFITFMHNGLFNNAAARMTTYRMIAHNWDEAHENGRIPGFRQLSGWRQGGGTGLTQGRDGSNWHYLNGSKFARNYGRFNPLEDFATTWESYFDRRFHNNEYRLNHVVAKHAVLDSFFASLRA